MKINSFILGGAFVATLLPTLAGATPQKHSDCSEQINEPQKSSGYFMSKDCETAYVLPPREGVLSLVSYSPTISTKVCEALDLIEERNVLNEGFRTAIAKAVTRKAKKYNELDSLIESGELPEGTSEDEALDELEEVTLKLLELKKALADDLINYVDEKSVYSVMEGGRGTFHLTSGYSELMNEFVKLNEDKKVRFTRMPLKNNLISVVDTVFKGEENKVEMKAIKRLLMAGEHLPVGNSVEAIANPETAREIRGIQNSIFGDGIAGALETSALGDCSIQKALEKDPDADPLRSDITARGKYEYEVQIQRKYSVTYNFKELVHIIRESSKSGGFFTRKTVNKLIDTRRTTSWLKFHSESNDTSYEYSDQDIKEIKKQFLDRALRQIVDVRSGGKATALALIDASGKNGSQVIGDELAKCPNIYCQIGAAGFKILGAIFGSEKATSEVLKKLNGDVHETSDERKMTTQVGTSVF